MRAQRCTETVPPSSSSWSISSFAFPMGLHVVETPNTELSTACASAQRSGAVLVTRPSIDQRSAADLGAAGVSEPDVGPVLPPGSPVRPHRVIRTGSLTILPGIHAHLGAWYPDTADSRDPARMGRRPPAEARALVRSRFCVSIPSVNSAGKRTTSPFRGPSSQGRNPWRC